jgi:tetraacyldisaccharide 4'-kinase
VVIVKCPDRVAGARLAIEKHGCNVLILDDGFQHVRIARDENILLVDATNPFGNRRLLPRGILREPLAAMRRATSIVVTRCDQAGDLPGLLAELRDLCPGIPVRLTYHRPVGLWRVTDGERVPLESIQGTRVSAVCAIANPDAFVTTLEAVGAVVTERRIHLDHAIISNRDLESDAMVVMTEKDAVRLRGSSQAPISSNVYALEIELCDFSEPQRGW